MNRRNKNVVQRAGKNYQISQRHADTIIRKIPARKFLSHGRRGGKEGCNLTKHDVLVVVHS